MKAASILIVLLWQQGYWLAGQDGKITARWAARGELPAADFSWELYYGAVRLSGGQAALEPGEKPATITITAPDVRTRSELRWTYRLVGREDKKELEKGEATIHVFPNTLASGWANRLKGKKVVVIDKAEGLPRFLSGAKVDFTRVEDPSKLTWIKADIVLIGPGQIDDSPFSQAPIVAQAEAGASVLMLSQDRPRTLGRFALSRRAAPSALAWKDDHPLFDRLSRADRQSWLEGLSGDVHAMQLPADAPVLEIASWPRETPGKRPVPIDALIAVQGTDNGRVVYWQLPLGDWRTDPRSQLVLDNCFSYFLTQPQATLPPSERQVPTSQEGLQVPVNTIPAGDSP